MIPEVYSTSDNVFSAASEKRFGMVSCRLRNMRPIEKRVTYRKLTDLRQTRKVQMLPETIVC